MKRVISTDILNTIDGEKKKALREKSVVNPADVAFAVGPDSWLADGREDYAVAAHIVGSIILSHDTDNRSDDAKGSHYFTIGNREKKRVEGNPVIWGALSQTQLTIMGTNDAPVLVVSAAGRQTAKASEWLSAYLQRCRAALQRAHAALSKEKEEAQVNLESLSKKLDKAKDKAAHAALMEEHRKILAKFEGKDVGKMAIADAVACLVMEHDAVADEFTQQHWSIIFEASRKLGRPLVDLTYSASVWLSVDYGADLPTDRRSLEKSMLANLQVPSLPSTVAASVQRLVRSYVLDGMLEAQALDKVRSYVRPFMAVGAQTGVSAAYVEKMYRLSMLCPAAQKAIDDEKDPRKMLALFDKYTRVLWRGGDEKVEDRILSRNDMTDGEQLEAMSPKPSAPKSKPKFAATDAQVVSRIGAIRSPMAGFSDLQREHARAIWAWEAYRAGNKAALKDFPHLVSAIEGKPVEEPKAKTASKPRSLAIDAADHWNGKSDKVLIDDLPDFCEKEPKATKDTELDAELLKSWNIRRVAHENAIKEAQRLLRSGLTKIRVGAKADQKPVLLREILEKQEI